MPNRLDQIYRSLRMTEYFVKGWGKPENLKRLCQFRKIVSNRDTCYNLVSPDHPVIIQKREDDKDCILIDGYFTTPFADYLPEVVPTACQKAYFQFVLPKKWPCENFKPVILQIAGTGDQYFWRRRHLIAKPLIKEAGIGSIILENPYYGMRRPQGQKRSILHNVSDVFVMGGCLILETIVLFHYCERLGLGPFGVTGLSMGGHMASLAATAWPKPIVIVPCLSGLTASHVFTQGVISNALNWKMLKKQYVSDLRLKDEVQKMVNIIEGDAFKAGQQFAKNFSKNGGTLETTFAASNDLDQVTNRLHQVGDSDTLLSRALPVSSNSVFVSSNSEAERTNESCDSYCKVDFVGDSTQSTVIDVTTAYNPKPHSLDESAGQAEAGDRVSSKEPASTETIVESLLNSVVRLARASVNLNILSSNKEDLELKRNETTSGEQEALNFMNGIMDELTHLKNYSVPVDASLTIAVCADDDAYVPSLQGRANLEAVWPGAEVRYVKGGHVRAYVQCQKEFRLAIVDAFQRYRSKYIDKSP